MTDPLINPEDLAKIMQDSLAQTVQSLQELQKGVVDQIKEASESVSPQGVLKTGDFGELEKKISEQQADMVKRLEKITTDLANNEVFTGIAKTVETAAKTFEEILKQLEG